MCSKVASDKVEWSCDSVTSRKRTTWPPGQIWMVMSGNKLRHSLQLRNKKLGRHGEKISEKISKIFLKLTANVASCYLFCFFSHNFSARSLPTLAVRPFILGCAATNSSNMARHNGWACVFFIPLFTYNHLAQKGQIILKLQNLPLRGMRVTCSRQRGQTTRRIKVWWVERLRGDWCGLHPPCFKGR